MHDDDDFLRKLLENPVDDTTRLVYADWLDERNDGESKVKAQFLRLTAQVPVPKGESRIARKLQRLAAGLNPDWLAVVSRLKIENCAGKQAEATQQLALLFEFVCDKRWDELTVTEDNAIRFCEGCKEHVHYCNTIDSAREHAEIGHCVAVDLGIRRRKGDLRPPTMLMGLMPPDTQREEEDRLRIDEVSRLWERQKREKKGEE